MTLFLVDVVTGVVTPADPSTPILAADDLAAVRGDGIFEAALLRRDVLRARDLHLARFERSARVMDLAGASREIWGPAVDRAAAEAGHGEYVVKWFLSRGNEDSHNSHPHGWITVTPVSDATMEARATGLTAITISRGYPVGMSSEAPWLLIGAKTLSYAVALAASRFANANGAGDAIYTTTDGFILEAPRSNVVIARGNELVTPDPALGLLHGTTQQEIFQRGAEAGWTTRYGRLRLDDLYSADGVWLTSSVRTAIRVTRLNGLVLTVAPGLDQVMQELVD
mgnify:CR=1 FL=1